MSALKIKSQDNQKYLTQNSRLYSVIDFQLKGTTISCVTQKATEKMKMKISKVVQKWLYFVNS